MGVVFTGQNGPLVRNLDVVDLGNVAANRTVDFHAGSDLSLTLDGNVQLTIVFPPESPGGGFRLKITQGAGAPFTPTFVFAGGPILAPSGSLGSFSTNPGDVDALTFVDRRTEAWAFKADAMGAI